MTDDAPHFRVGRPPSTHLHDLISLFEERAGRFSALPAISASDQTMTFAELERQSRNFAAHLQTLQGLGTGEPVAVMMNNCREYVAAAWGVLRAGMVLVNTNPMYTQRELAIQFRDSGAKALIVESGCGAKVSSIIPQTQIAYVYVKQTDDAWRADREGAGFRSYDLVRTLECDGVYRRPETSGDSVAILQYTGGTTGRSKGAVLSHANLVANIRQSWSTLETVREAGEIALVPLPLYHIYAFAWGLLVFLMHGAHLVLIEDPRQGDRIVDAMKQFAVTCFFGLNSLFISLLQNPRLSTVDFRALHITLSGGAPLPIDTALQWERRTGCPIFEGYGLTEASPVVTVNTPRFRKLGTVGRAVPGTELKLIDDDGNDSAPGEAGELCIRGPQIMREYWRQEEETRMVLTADGWLRTGDIATIDEEGFVTILDRKKDLIIVSGFNVYPSEIDQVVSHHPDVLECAAVGVNDAKSGHAIRLFVVRRSQSLTEPELQAYCRERLAAYKVPRRVVFVDALPKSPVGKVLRRELQ